jgi:hypothetical protein
MQGFLAVLAVVVAFVVGRETKTVVHAKPAVMMQREVVTVQAPPVRCPSAPAIAEIEQRQTEDVAVEADEPAGIDIADTAAVRQLDREARLRTTLEANVHARGAIVGSARDAQTGELLVGVTVVVGARGTDQVALTDETGYYQITDLDPDTYTVTFYYADATIEHAGISVAAHKSTPLNPKFDSNGGSTYVKNIPITRHFEPVLNEADGEGVSFTGTTTVENEYVVEE